MTSTESPDYNEPLNHPFLAELLADTPPKELNSFVVARYRKAVTAAMALPAGESREHVLHALNSAVHASRRVRTLVDQVSDMQAVLKAEQPAKSQMLKAIDVIGLHVKSLHTKFAQTWDREKKAARDPGAGYWTWFDHELHATTAAIEYSARGLLIPEEAKSAGDSAGAPAQGDASR